MSDNNMYNLPSAVLSYLQYQSIIGDNQKKFQNLAARSSINNLIIINNLFLKWKPEHTLEVGMAFGLSTLLFLDLHNQLYKQNELESSQKSENISKNLSGNKKHCAIDPFQLSVWDNTGLSIVKKYGYQDLLDFYQDFSYNVLPSLLKNKKYNLIYIDGSHLFEDVFIDFYYCFHLLEEDGILLFDDCSSVQVLKVVKFIRNNFKKQLKEVNLLHYRGKIDWAGKVKYYVGRSLGKIQACAFQKVSSEVRPYDSRLVQF